MPVMRRCSHPTCNKLISFNESYCDKHKTYTNAKYNDVRQRNDPEYLRFYKSKQWQNLREIVMMENDYICQSCGRQANVVDHIIPTKVDWSKRLDKNNLQPLCNECHNKKTKNEAPHIKARGGSGRG
ncbi:HNH endonuclease [Staphylococcus coagulans]|uniref:Putative HNH nuclease YajD n=1 Tax=Staphylococcus coagulans TaxID=74706 RepID=A0ABU1EXC2_9STAP|nr:HNH endonuclease [Staphylococcus coagulans]MDR5602776.1 HNH endonuclease [Staphylococcus coagulans]